MNRNTPTFQTQRRSKEEMENAKRLHEEIDELKKFDQERSIILQAFNKVKENPNFFDDKPEALKTFNTLLGRHNLPEYSKSIFGNNTTNTAPTNSTQQPVNPIKQNNFTQPIDGLYNGGTPFTAPKSSGAAQLWRDTYGHGYDPTRPGYKTSSGQVTDYGTKFDQGRQNNGIFLHHINL